MFYLWIAIIALCIASILSYSDWRTKARNERVLYKKECWELQANVNFAVQSILLLIITFALLLASA